MFGEESMQSSPHEHGGRLKINWVMKDISSKGFRCIWGEDEAGSSYLNR